MQIAIFTTYAASRKEPLAEVLTRIHAAFLAHEFGEPMIRFTMTDGTQGAMAEQLGVKQISSVDRVLKRFPEMGRFLRTRLADLATTATAKALTNDGMPDEAADFATLAAIAAGVPRSFPFPRITFHLSAPGFGGGPIAAPDPQALRALARAGIDIGSAALAPGIAIKDNWWVNGRERAVSALWIADGDPTAKKLPPPPPAVAAVLAACGKARKTAQIPMAAAPPTPPSAPVNEAMRAVIHAWHASMPALLDSLPHDLPPSDDTLVSPGGVRKPDLVRVFAPLGYDCRGEHGSFTLRRRTPGNLTVELVIDVGTWSNQVLAFLRVQGLMGTEAFKVSIGLPAAKRALTGDIRGVPSFGQFPIGGPERWSQIADNLAAAVSAAERNFVPAIEAISGPSPDWYQPQTG